MSVLHFKSRPWTVFDASNKDHRRWYSQFVTHGGWGQCPYRFIVPDSHGDLISMCHRAMVKWYVAHEFANVKKTTQKKVQ